MTRDPIQAFIDRWSPSGGAELANYQSFLGELCDLVDVSRPDPTVPDDDANAYVFERRVVFTNPDGSHSFGRFDLYKRGCFVLETKQGIEKQDDETVLSTAAQQRKNRRRKGHGTRGTTAWNDTLLRARGQAEQYARSLTNPETRPPFRGRPAGDIQLAPADAGGVSGTSSWRGLEQHRDIQPASTGARGDAVKNFALRT
jgi:hypothetical protein